MREQVASVVLIVEGTIGSSSKVEYHFFYELDEPLQDHVLVPTIVKCYDSRGTDSISHPIYRNKQIYDQPFEQYIDAQIPPTFRMKEVQLSTILWQGD